MAAETGSGKTGTSLFTSIDFYLIYYNHHKMIGAFCLPVLQIVYETLKDIQEQKGMKPSSAPKNASVGFRMSAYDRTPAMG